MIIFTRSGCPDCVRLINVLTDLSMGFEVMDGEDILTRQLTGTPVLSKEDAVDLLAELSMQDDEFPIIKHEGKFYGKKKFTSLLGVVSDEA